MTDAERINQIADELMAYQPVIDIPFERFNDIALAIVTLGYVSKEEVENLKENRNGWRNRAWNDEKTIFELQEQVDELTRKNIAFATVIDSYENGEVSAETVATAITRYYEPIAKKFKEQAVKDTAQEILQRIMNIIKKSDGFLAQEVVRIMAKQKGVEVAEC